MDTITCDTRIDETPTHYAAACTCGWLRWVKYGRKIPVPCTRDNAYALALDLVRAHNPV